MKITLKWVCKGIRATPIHLSKLTHGGMDHLQIDWIQKGCAGLSSILAQTGFGMRRLNVFQGWINVWETCQRALSFVIQAYGRFYAGFLQVPQPIIALNQVKVILHFNFRYSKLLQPQCSNYSFVCMSLWTVNKLIFVSMPLCVLV